MSLENASSVTVNQCLFGYDDGHRLLAASLRLPADVSAQLLPLSDLAPGVKADPVGYWTAVPLPSTKLFALLRTWPAPEIPRPGCVWTHALLLRFSDLQRILDLGALRSLIRRPTPSNLAPYRTPFQLEEGIGEHRDHEPSVPESLRRALGLIRAVYAKDTTATITAKAGSLDDLVFALWSQQWPRLRQSFAFRTAGAHREVPGPAQRFDLIVVAKGDVSMPVGTQAEEWRPWEALAAEDLLISPPTDLRRFLWRYGVDLKRSRDRFQFLVQLFEETRFRRMSTHDTKDILHIVATTIPLADEGLTLKKDLVLGEYPSHSLVPTLEPLAVIEFLAEYPDAALAIPLSEVLTKAVASGVTGAESVLALVEMALASDAKWAPTLLEWLRHEVASRPLLTPIARLPLVRRVVVATHPEILDSPELSQMSRETIGELIALIDTESPAVEPILKRLVLLDDSDVASSTYERFRTSTVEVVVSCLQENALARDACLAPAWLPFPSFLRREFLKSSVIPNSRSLRLLGRFAKAVDYDSPEVLESGPVPWASAILEADDDISPTERQTLFVFFLAVALGSDDHGAEPLLEIAFDPVYADLSHGQMSHAAMAMLERHLPDFPWWSRWDSCLRLRRAVAATYLEKHLNPLRFRRITRDDYVLGLMVEFIGESVRGRKFLKKAGVKE